MAKGFDHATRAHETMVIRIPPGEAIELEVGRFFLLDEASCRAEAGDFLSCTSKKAGSP